MADIKAEILNLTGGHGAECVIGTFLCRVRVRACVRRACRACRACCAGLTLTSIIYLTDFVGSPDTMSLAMALLRKHGRLLVVGLFGGEARLPIPLVPLRAFTIKGSAW